MDKKAIEALGAELDGSKRPLIVTSGVALLTQGRAATEKDVPPPPGPTTFPRASEDTAAKLAASGINASVVRLPQVHDPVKQGLISYVIAVAREKGLSPYVGEGLNGWAAAHVSDVARLYRLALEKHQANARYHAVAEEGVAFRKIAEVVGKGLRVPVKSITPEEAAAHFGWLGRFVAWTCALPAHKRSSFWIGAPLAPVSLPTSNRWITPNPEPTFLCCAGSSHR
jgi:nucleoside-diphosphate-sugar epimerase